MTRPTVEQLRTLHGRSTASWVGGGTLVLGQSHWIALSGAAHVDYNMAMCHGPHGADHLAECLELITGARRPAIVALAGEARTQGEQTLLDAQWSRVGAAPLMTRSTSGATADPRVRRLTPQELPLARALVGDVFGLPPAIAEVALTVDAAAVPNRSVWGLWLGDRLVTAVSLVHLGPAVVMWSMATDPRERRRGYGRATVDSVLARTRDQDGAERFLMHSSSLGEPLYAAAGFEVVERWDFWSRRRWVLAAG